VRYGGPDAAPVTTDGPLPETSDLVAGWYMIDVESHERAVELGAGVLQIPARSPAMTAMTEATLDALSNGRFRLGQGVSGPQVARGPPEGAVRRRTPT
jgi:hypothetical protein